MQQRSTDFVVNRILMKLFKTNNMDVVSYCRTVSCWITEHCCWTTH